MKLAAYDAVLIMSFGGPEGPADVMPFLDNVLWGRNVPEDRKREVAHHYEMFGGVSPINAQNRALQAALAREIKLPVFLGNRNWHPLIADTVAEMKKAGVKRFLTFVASAFSSYSGCRQYREDIERAAKPAGLSFDKIRVFYNHPGFIEVWRENISAELARMPNAHVVFTAHSVPQAMSDKSDYVAQLNDACSLVAKAAGLADWRLVYQSRSGSPHQPWLGPDICEYLRACGKRYVILAPIGFISDHVEVLYDLDYEAKNLCAELGIEMARAKTPGVHSRFVSMIGELIAERLDPSVPKRSLGARGPKEDVCPENCCRPR